MTQSETPLLTDHAPNASRFRREVLRGLGADPKSVPPKYLYDQRGSQLFDEICELDEYYPTRTELAIMRRHIAEMSAHVGPRVCLIEYGSGSSLKIRLLLDHLEEPAAYVPIDISRDHLVEAADLLAVDYPDLAILPVCADFMEPFELPDGMDGEARKIVYFPGSTIGNLHPPQAARLLRSIADLCEPDGGLLIGVDLKKDPRTLEAAYNDRRGVTARFNLNLLHHVNRVLDADFDPSAFRHHAFYNAEIGRVEMHLFSRRRQRVRIADRVFDFEEDESIHTENSYKYSPEEFAALAARAGLGVRKCWTDPQRLFSVQFLTVDQPAE